MRLFLSVIEPCVRPLIETTNESCPPWIQLFEQPMRADLLGAGLLELPDVGDPPEAVAQDEDHHDCQAHLYTFLNLFKLSIIFII
jgi:hypothetical protein